MLWVFDAFKASRGEILLSGWNFSMNFIFSGPPVMGTMFLTCKMLKNYYIKMEEKLALTKENANAELQLLKAQIHPHFLFNTLNNIYSFTLTKSPKAGRLALQLSDTFRYMINDCENSLVPLDKELKMIEDYISLEKVRYGNRLKLELTLKGDSNNKQIPPLLLIPFVENSFKHGSSKMIKNPWIKLTIMITGNILYMDLNNSKPLQVISENGRNGIGLKNVTKRLQLLFPDQHELLIEPGDDEFRVHLQIPLEQPATVGMMDQAISVSQSPSYA